MTAKTKNTKKVWPYNSELYMTFREIRIEIPKLSFAHTFHVNKPIKPNGTKK